MPLPSRSAPASPAAWPRHADPLVGRHSQVMAHRVVGNTSASGIKQRLNRERVWRSVYRVPLDEPPWCYFQSPSKRRPNARVMHGVPRIAVAKVVLHCAQISAAIGQIVAAGVAKCMRMHIAQARLLSCHGHEAVDRALGERLPALRDKEPRQSILATCQIALDGA
jgi:hypothetical protein